MRRISLALFALGVVVLTVALANAPATRSVRAQTADPLAMLALNTGDLPGYAVVSEDPNFIPGNSMAFYRVLNATDTAGTGNAEVTVALVGWSDPNTRSPTQAELLQGRLLRDWFGDDEGFQPTAQLGIGEIDSAATWQSAGSDGALQTVYGDAFVRGGIVAVVTYRANPDEIDPTQIGVVAHLQDLKLFYAANAATPAAATASASPSTSPSPSPTPQPTPTTPRLITTASLIAIGLQPTDALNLVHDASVPQPTTMPSNGLAEYFDAFDLRMPEVGRSSSVLLGLTQIVERMATFDSAADARAGVFPPFQALVAPAASGFGPDQVNGIVVSQMQLPALGLGDVDFTQSYQLLTPITNTKYQAFEESAIVGTTVVDITVLSSSSAITVNDVAFYARIVVGRAAAAQH